MTYEESGDSKKVFVRAHYRQHKANVYEFTCAKCQQETKRKSFAASCPKYCFSCSKKGANKIEEGKSIRVRQLNLFVDTGNLDLLD